jgi:hypothetical protein
LLAGDDRDRCERPGAAAVPVQVAGDPLGVDVELDRAHHTGAEQRVGESADRGVLGAGLHDVAVGLDPERRASRVDHPTEGRARAAETVER